MSLKKLMSEMGGSGKKGSFKEMALPDELYAGLKKMKYHRPTPIQKKVIPRALEGKDIAAMARTGSGKTGAFLIPIIHRLKRHSEAMGIRAVIISPTRDLAMQTQNFLSRMAHATDLRVAVLVGGEALSLQFDALSMNPDIIVGTPGRVAHILDEADVGLNKVKVAVFDEADRLFEMGFAGQLHELLKRLPKGRQTMLLSATMPSSLWEFTRAALRDPVVIRLDTDVRVSPKLSIAHFLVRPDEKTAALLDIMLNIIPKGTWTIIFAATRHHVEFLARLLTLCDLQCVCTYSSMEPGERKEAVQIFRDGLVKILVVTDLAARGIDVPLLDYVVNYDMTGKAKDWIHRVGRVARQGRRGTTFSIICPCDRPYLCDLHRYLGKPALLPAPEGRGSFENFDIIPSVVHFGSIPQNRLAIMEAEYQARIREDKGVLSNYWKKCEGAYKLFYKTRPNAMKAGAKEARKLFTKINIHPLFYSEWLTDKVPCPDMDELKFKDNIGDFKVPRTIFEIHITKNNPANLVMQQKRKLHTIANLLAYKEPKSEDKEITTEEMEDYFGQPKPKKPKFANVDKYKDPSFFIEMESQHKDDEGGGEREEFLGVGARGRYEKLVAALDVTDMTDPLIKKQKFHRWDPRQGKYITSYFGDKFRAAGIRRNEAGVIVDPKKVSGRWKRGAAYRRWQKDQNREIEGVGRPDTGNISHKDVHERGHTNLLSLGVSKHRFGDKEAKEARQLKYKQILENRRIKRKRKEKDKKRKLMKSWMARKKRLSGGKRKKR